MTPLVILVIGGGAERLGCPDAESPLAKAATPHLDRLAGEGRVFPVALSRDVVEAQGAAPILSLFGIDPASHAVSRASLLAVGRETPLQSGECYVSADFVSLFRRYHEALDNVTPMDAYFHRQYAVVSEREKIKKRTMRKRKREYLAAMAA